MADETQIAVENAGPDLRLPKVHLTEIVFSGQGKLNLNNDDIVIFVGPNNSGKSQTLRDMFNWIQRNDHNNFRGVCVSSMKMLKDSSLEQLRAFLEKYARRNDNYELHDWRMPVHSINTYNGPNLGQCFPPFVKVLDARNRLNLTNLQNSRDPDQPASKPQHVLVDSDAKLEEISATFRAAFGAGLVIDFKGGSKIPIHVGDRPSGDEMIDRAGDAYTLAVRAMPRLHEQGDGMQSYAGIIFETLVVGRDIILIDEPEAFLHPPQMRLLGQTLAEKASGQLFIATHSSDIVRGFLEGSNGNVRIVRLKREQEGTFVFEAAPEIVRDFWTVPILRFSNALDGLFHEQCIICEDDSDCRLYSAVADSCASNATLRWPDTHYVPTGGKAAIPNVALALKKAGVPTKAIVDIDLLADATLLEKFIQAFGGNWPDYEPIWRQVDSAVRDGVKPLNIEEIKNGIVELLRESEGIPKSDIIALMKDGKPWSIVKKLGATAIPNGDPTKNFQLLNEKLQEIGIFIVSSGEVENFVKSAGAHGPKFVNRVLNDIGVDAPECNELRDFVSSVVPRRLTSV